jgi:transcriptional regulator with XRE-family HTH domain
MGGEETLLFFCDWLKAWRKSLDLPQEELSQRSGCSAHALRKIESGERRPSKQLAGLLAQSLEIPTKERETFIKVTRGERCLERLQKTYSRPVDRRGDQARPRSLPIQFPGISTSTLGRQSELSTLGCLLEDPPCRLLTLTGPGGVDKNHWAIELASQQ